MSISTIFHGHGLRIHLLPCRNDELESREVHSPTDEYEHEYEYEYEYAYEYGYYEDGNMSGDEIEYEAYYDEESERPGPKNPPKRKR